MSYYINPVQQDARLIVQLDCLSSFAQQAVQENYNKPEIDDSTELEIKNGRHPVIEKQLPHGEQYNRNDVFLDNETTQFIIISLHYNIYKLHFLIKMALIVWMTQMGCYVMDVSAYI